MKKNENPLLRKLRHADEAYGLYRTGEKTLVGFSGGADSTALLHALATYLGTENVAAVHINHMLRGEEADADERFCESFCRERGIRFFSRRVDVNALCGGKSFEETARNVRYEIFHEVARAADCMTVSLAHTADDNLETVIFHLCRGAGASGIAGIPPKRPMSERAIVRPLIDCTRAEILAYIEKNGLSHQTDATNENTAYTRNFIRKTIVPLLREINPAVTENMRGTSAAIAALSAHIEAEAEELLPDETTAEIPLSRLRGKSDALLYAVCNRLYQNAGGLALPSVQANSLISFIRNEKRGIRLSLPRSITAELRGEHLRFFAGADEPHPLTEEISLHFGENRVTDRIRIYVGVPCEAENIYFSAIADIPSASLPSLTVRPRKGGESYRFGGMTRVLKKLLSGAETAKKDRPVLCDASGILWHPDFPVRDTDENTEKTRIHYVEIK